MSPRLVHPTWCFPAAVQISRARNARGAGYAFGLVEGYARGLGFDAQPPAVTTPHAGYDDGLVDGYAQAVDFQTGAGQ